MKKKINLFYHHSKSQTCGPVRWLSGRKVLPASLVTWTHRENRLRRVVFCLLHTYLAHPPPNNHVLSIQLLPLVMPFLVSFLHLDYLIQQWCVDWFLVLKGWWSVLSYTHRHTYTAPHCTTPHTTWGKNFWWTFSVWLIAKLNLPSAHTPLFSKLCSKVRNAQLLRTAATMVELCPCLCITALVQGVGVASTSGNSTSGSGVYLTYSYQ